MLHYYDDDIIGLYQGSPKTKGFAGIVLFFTMKRESVVRREDPHILVCVSDTGVGIAAERLPHIFERYSKKQKSGGGQDTGTGLGLYICKHIVEQRGGTIWIESKEGQGTDLFFTLPVL